MAHEIDQTRFANGAAFYVREPAWHGLGTVVQEAQTSADAIGLAGLDWEVKSFPVFTRVDGEMVAAPDRVANVRTDTKAVLGVVSDQYRIFQNREAFAFMDYIVQENLALWHTAGSLRGGRRVWMLAKLPTTVEISSRDPVESYVLITNGHDGLSSLRILPTMVRVVCANTLNLALARAGSEGLALSHFSTLEGRVAEARAKLGILSKRIDEFGEEARAMSHRSLNTEELRNFFVEMVEGRSEKGQKKLLTRLFDNLSDPINSLPGMSGTAWAAYNAVSQWADHQSHGEKNHRSEKRLNSVWFGAANSMKQRAFAAALKLVG